LLRAYAANKKLKSAAAAAAGGAIIITTALSVPQSRDSKHLRFEKPQLRFDCEWNRAIGDLRFRDTKRQRHLRYCLHGHFTWQPALSQLPRH